MFTFSLPGLRVFFSTSSSKLSSNPSFSKKLSWWPQTKWLFLVLHFQTALLSFHHVLELLLTIFSSFKSQWTPHSKGESILWAFPQPIGLSTGLDYSGKSKDIYLNLRLFLNSNLLHGMTPTLKITRRRWNDKQRLALFFLRECLEQTEPTEKRLEKKKASAKLERREILEKENSRNLEFGKEKQVSLENQTEPILFGRRSWFGGHAHDSHLSWPTWWPMYA